VRLVLSSGEGSDENSDGTTVTVRTEPEKFIADDYHSRST
jgi:hypothetical protein